jgi:hypothetical protein
VAASTNFVLGEAACGKKMGVLSITSGSIGKSRKSLGVGYPGEEVEKDKTFVTFWSLTGGIDM